MAYNTVKIVKYSDCVAEIQAAGAITPGFLLEYDSSGYVQAHSTSAGVAAKMFALENELEGEEITDAYASGEKVQVWFPSPGDVVYALLADGENASKGDYLDSNGDGYLKVYDGTTMSDVEYPNSIIGVAIDAVDMSGSSGADPTGRICVRII